MRGPSTLLLLLLGSLVGTALTVSIGPVHAAEPPAPAYLPYEQFTADDTPERIAVKRGYNEAVQRYNQTLYDYHVTLERHDRLVDLHNNAAAASGERRRARDEAQAIRVRLVELQREVTRRAQAVDQAWRRAASAGVTITR